MKHEDRYLKLADFGRELLNKKSIPEGLPHISAYVKEVIRAQRCSIFIYDSFNKELWTTLSDGIDKIIISSDKGLVGYTLKERKPLIENDPYSNPNFLPEVDELTGYKTQNIITAPIFNSSRDIIGVLELLNKDGGFDEEDIKFMIFFSHYISGFLELINIYLDEESGE